MPYDGFKDVKQIVKGDLEQYIIYQNEEVELKKFDNFVNLNDVLNEMEIHLKAYNRVASIQFYGITQDPETHSYMMVLEYEQMRIFEKI
ncbi:hypothetical protein Glove_15g22 [Diversispora epigaea]|uniref:Protein kinase domain-containing protein n=1 Tax=Diversispora epigaea TaxID=1348612 RepID=A0A397JLZ2_9GLOM|nr:hypothetical protein Glove_15g22 [Diversispora epigaea]